MKRLLNSIHAYYLKKAHSITINQANIFTISFIFVFTIIFAYLLITENYNDYERALVKQQKIFNIGGVLDKQLAYEFTQSKLKKMLIKNTMAIATLSFILFAVMLGIYNVFNNLLHRDIQAFLVFFKETAHNEQVLNPDVIFFKEFQTMVGYANEMVDTINEQKKSLQELNTGLEDIVEAKTQDLKNILDAQKEFLRYTIHETNTPLSVILASIELYEMNNVKDRNLSKIEAAAKNIFNIYDDLSYLVKKDQIEYPKIAIELENFIRSRIDFFAEVALLSKLEFSFSSDIKDGYVYINETKLQRIVDNTLTNAIKYTYQNEIVEVSLKQDGWHVEFSVGSYSQPIKDSDKIFDEYYRENIKNNEHIQGFGIGLQLVKNICKEEDIKISTSSGTEKNIFTYRFTLMGE